MFNKNKILCFIIDNKKLYLEYSLILLDNIPQLFVCKNNLNEYFLALYIEQNNKILYYIFQISLQTLFDFLNSKISFYDCFFKNIHFWTIKPFSTSSSFDNDIIILNSNNSINLSFIPDSHEKYQPVSDLDFKFKKYIENQLKKIS